MHEVIPLRLLLPKATETKVKVLLGVAMETVGEDGHVALITPVSSAWRYTEKIQSPAASGMDRERGSYTNPYALEDVHLWRYRESQSGPVYTSLWWREDRREGGGREAARGGGREERRLEGGRMEREGEREGEGGEREGKGGREEGGRREGGGTREGEREMRKREGEREGEGEREKGKRGREGEREEGKGGREREEPLRLLLARATETNFLVCAWWLLSYV